METTEITGVFSAGDASPFWPMGALRVCVYKLPFVSRLVEYSLTGPVFGNVLYPDFIALRPLPMGDRVSIALWDVPVAELTPTCKYIAKRLQRLNRPANETEAFWESVPGRIAKWSKRPGIVDEVRERTVRQGRTHVHDAEMLPHPVAAYEALLDTEELVVFREDHWMAGEVYRALGRVDAAHQDPNLVWTHGFCEHADVNFAETIDVHVLLGMIAVAGGEKTQTIAGFPEFAARHCIYNGRNLPRFTTVHPLLFPVVDTLPEGHGIVKSEEKRIWVAANARGVGVDFGMSMCVCTSDLGGLEKTRAMANVCEVRRARFAQPAVGYHYRSRETGEVIKVRGVAGGSIQVSERVCLPAHDFWCDYTPFAACFAHEVVPGIDVYVCLATHETSRVDLARCFAYCTTALVVVGMGAREVETLLG